jgi:hypothetical protein
VLTDGRPSNKTSTKEGRNTLEGHAHRAMHARWPRMVNVYFDLKINLKLYGRLKLKKNKKASLELTT